MPIKVKKKLWQTYKLDELNELSDDVEVLFSVIKSNETAFRNYCSDWTKKKGFSVSVQKLEDKFIVTRLN